MRDRVKRSKGGRSAERAGTDREMRMGRGSREGRVSEYERKQRREEEAEKEESVRTVGRRVGY